MEETVGWSLGRGEVLAQWQSQDHWQMYDIKKNTPVLSGTQLCCLQNERVENTL